jgi:DNA-binding CsgD family transcriptional regulator
MSTEIASTDIDNGPLRQFTQAFGGHARTLLAATGWVTYVVDPNWRFAHFLATGTSRVEQQAYASGFAALDPLAPGRCLAHDQSVAALHDKMSRAMDDHLAYQSGFLDRHGIVDALEIFLRSESDLIVGCSLLRHQAAPQFSSDDLAKADALRAIGDLALARAFPRLPTSPVTIARRFPALTPREVTLVQLVAEGLNNKQVCRSLDISLPTVKTHLLNVFRKLGIGSRTELVARILGGL